MEDQDCTLKYEYVATRSLGDRIAAYLFVVARVVKMAIVTFAPSTVLLGTLARVPVKMRTLMMVCRISR